MLRYRTFQNADPPLLAEIWRSRAAVDDAIEPVSVELFERLVFAKPYFDYQGLILALNDDSPVGFAHAGFGPSPAEDELSTRSGVTCLLIVRPGCQEAEVAGGLLERTEEYLQGRGATVLYGGAARPMAPFYFGLYGGSEPPGVLASDTASLDAYRAHGYTEVERRLLFRLRLEGFRPLIDRQQMHCRRRVQVEEHADPAPDSWWDACMTGGLHLTRVALVPRDGSQAVATATFRNYEPALDIAAGLTAGLIGCKVHASAQRQGLGTFLLCESFRLLARQGVTCIEAQANRDNIAGLALLKKMQMQPAGEGIVFRKEVETR